MHSLHELDLRIPPAKVALSNSESPATLARLYPVPSVLIARGGSIRTKQDRAVTFELSCEYQGYHSPQIVILSPPQHGKLADRCIVPFIPMTEDSSADETPLHEPARVNAQIRCYLPRAGFLGVDEFSYMLSDGVSHSEPATVKILVSRENLVPEALPQHVAVKMGESVWIQLKGIDVDNDALEFNIASEPSRGTLRRPAMEDCFCSFLTEQEGIEFPFAPLSNVFIYEPTMDDDDAAAFSDSPLPDVFTFTVTDGSAVSAPATVNIEIRPFNRAPEAVITVDQSIDLWNGAGKYVIVSNAKLEAEVLFDSSNSIEPDGDPMEVWWSRLLPAETPSSGKCPVMDESPIANGMKLSTTLPVGKHTIIANVSDGSLEDRCELRVTVLSPVQAIKRLARDVRGGGFSPLVQKDLLMMLRHAAKFVSVQKFKEMSGALDQFISRMRMISGEESSRLHALADTAEEILNAVEDARSKIIRPASFLR